MGNCWAVGTGNGCWGVGGLVRIEERDSEFEEALDPS